MAAISPSSPRKLCLGEQVVRAFVRISLTLGLSLVCTLVARAMTASSGASRPSDLPPSFLRQVVRRAPIVFGGQLRSVSRDPAWPGMVTAHFFVEAAVQGRPPGPFTARFVEAAPGLFPLRPGQRFILFLHALNAAGLTSPLAGACGILLRTGNDEVDLRQLRLCRLPGPAGDAADWTPGPERMPGTCLLQLLQSVARDGSTANKRDPMEEAQGEARAHMSAAGPEVRHDR